MTDEEIAALKAGDGVGVGDSMGSVSIQTVVRITATMIVTNRERFNKKTGIVVGHTGWFPRRLVNTAEAKQHIHRQHLVSFVERYQWRDLTIERLESVKTLLDSFAVATPSQESLQENATAK